MSCLRILTAACALVGALSAHAAPVHLSGLLSLALQQHPTVVQAKQLVDASQHTLDAADWGRYPSVVSELRSDSSATQSIVKVEQPLWSGGRIQGKIDVAKADLLIAKANLTEAHLNALGQVSGAFFDLLRLKERLVIARENVHEHQQLQALISRREQAQISPPADATLAQARLQQALTEEMQIRRLFDATLSALTQWVGPINGEAVEPRKIDAQGISNQATLLDQAMAASGQRQKLLAQVESAEAQIQLAQAQGRPTVVAGYQHIVSGPLTAGTDRGHTYVGLQFQPGAGLSAQAEVAAAVARKYAAEQELQIFDRNLQMQVQTLTSDITALESQLAPSMAIRTGTTDLLASYLRQYQAGRKTWLDVLNALREKAQAVYNAIDVKYGLTQAQVKMLVLTGEIRQNHLNAIHE